MVDTLTGMLGDRLVAVVVYGSHVSGDAIASFSDLDLSIVLRGELTIDDALRLHRAMPEPAGVPYIQPSYHDVAALQPHLVPGGYRELYGMIPAGLVLDEPSLIRSGEVLRDLPVLVHDDARAWTGAVAEKRARHVRMMTTRLKPAVRAVLVVLGEPVVPTWLTPWDGLVDVWRRHDPPARGPCGGPGSAPGTASGR